MSSFFESATDVVRLPFLHLLCAYCREMGTTLEPAQLQVQPGTATDGVWVPVSYLTEEGRRILVVELGAPPVKLLFSLNNNPVRVLQLGQQEGPSHQSANSICIHLAGLVFDQLGRWDWNDPQLLGILAPFAHIVLTVKNGQIDILGDVPEDSLAYTASVAVVDLPDWVQGWVRSVLGDDIIEMRDAFGRNSFLVTPPSFREVCYLNRAHTSHAQRG